MNRPSKHLGPLSLGILLRSTSLVTSPTSGVFESGFYCCEYETVRPIVATFCYRCPLFLLWWLRTLPPQSSTSTLAQIAAASRTIRALHAPTPRDSRRPPNWPASFTQAIRYGLLLCCILVYCMPTVSLHACTAVQGSSSIRPNADTYVV
jgi:hypothetical protein